MPFETNDPVKELRDKAREMFPHNEELARSTYLWNAADEIEKWQRATHDLLLRQGYAKETLEPALRNLKD